MRRQPRRHLHLVETQPRPHPTGTQPHLPTRAVRRHADLHRVDARDLRHDIHRHLRLVTRGTDPDELPA
jgi:hypothetical protein